MKKPPAKPTEFRCPACDGTGFPKVTKEMPPSRKIYPAPCKECSGKGRIKEGRQLRPYFGGCNSLFRQPKAFVFIGSDAITFCSL
jgi:ssDNA-binding Zn-finger/Zn-ribbon topoisomerase 1